MKMHMAVVMALAAFVIGSWAGTVTTVIAVERECTGKGRLYYNEPIFQKPLHIKCETVTEIKK